MSENTDKPLTAAPGQPVTLRNCWTCGWDNRALMQCGPIYEMVEDMDAIERWLYAAAGDNDYPPETADGCPGWKPKDEPANTDRQQIAMLGSDPFPAVQHPTIPEVVEALEDMAAETMVVKRAEWDALLARIAAIESRVDDAERVARKVGPRFEALRRRDRLRGGR